MTKLTKILLNCFLFLLVIQACSGQGMESASESIPTSTPTIFIKEPAISPTNTALRYTSTPKPTNAPVSDQVIEKKEPWLTNTPLEPGEYIYLETFDSTRNLEVFAFSIEKKELIPIATNVHLRLIGNKGLLIQFQFDEDMQMYETIGLLWLSNPEKVSEITADCWYRDVSPDGRYLLASYCKENPGDDSTDNIVIHDRLTDKIIQLTDEKISKEGYRYICNPTFSPDGQWISYTDTPLGYTPEFDEQHGLYIMPTSCIENPSTCAESTLGPFLSDTMALSDGFFRYSWSPDSQRIALPGVGAHNLIIFDLSSKSFTGLYLSVLPEWGIEMTDWSFDGKKILYHSYSPELDRTLGGGDIYIYILETQETEVVTISSNNIYIVQWITID